MKGKAGEPAFDVGRSMFDVRSATNSRYGHATRFLT
jgi:hypothetical protein